MQPPVILWFRRDLRLDDNPALQAALANGSPILPLFVHSSGGGDWQAGAASRVWRYQSLQKLDTTLRDRGSRLILRKGDPSDVIRSIAHETKATAVYATKHAAPPEEATSFEVQNLMAEMGVDYHLAEGELLYPAGSILSKSKTPYKVYGQFWKACLQAGSPELPQEAPASISAPEFWPESSSIEELRLLPSEDWGGRIIDHWTPGEEGAKVALNRFLEEGLHDYEQMREIPSKRGTSFLSPHIAHGEIGIRRVWYELERMEASGYGNADDLTRFRAELGWREFSHHVLHFFQSSTTQPFNPRFTHFPWIDDAESLEAWRKGKTGYPIVDAGMRQLWEMGWMHNRVRMIVASFLTKHLLLPWQSGARWFWDTLVDADLSNNTMGWQWSAGTGADAAPYFRIFNPTAQGEKYDPEGEYVRRWVPELASLSSLWIHKPWEAPASELQKAGLELGSGYPRPIVDHAAARERALHAFQSLREDS